MKCSGPDIPLAMCRRMVDRASENGAADVTPKATAPSRVATCSRSCLVGVLVSITQGYGGYVD